MMYATGSKGPRQAPAACVIALLLTAASASVSAATFGRSDGPPQALLDELHQIVSKAERERSADRDYLAALRNYIDKYDQPWTRAVLNDAFADGDYTRSPAWKVTAGQFTVDRRYGLYSRATTSTAGGSAGSGSGSDKGKVAEQLAAALLGSILNQGQRNQGAGSSSAQTSAPRGEARIATSIDSGNSFAVDVEVSGLSRGAALQLGLQESATSRNGYRVVLESDGRMQLIALNSRGSAILDSADVNAINPQQRQRLRWTRGRTGRMRVELNGRAVLNAEDTSNRQGFRELSLVNVGGELGIRQIAIASAAR